MNTNFVKIFEDGKNFENTSGDLAILTEANKLGAVWAKK